MALWKITCEEHLYPGMWQRWFLNQCVAVGWNAGEGCPLRGEIANDEARAGWTTCRNRLLEMVIGDHVIVALRGHRVARIGQIARLAVEDDEWDPLVSPDILPPFGHVGRRIHIRWDLMTGPSNSDLVVALPESCRFNSGELVPAVSRVRSVERDGLVAVMNDPANWVDLLGHFKYETALSGYIAAYPHRLEDGLTQHPNLRVREMVFDDKTRSDVLLLDRQGRPVIVECKQHSPTIVACDQLRGYMKKFADRTGTMARGILVHGGSGKLHRDIARYAKRSPRIEIIRYRLDVDFSPCT